MVCSAMLVVKTRPKPAASSFLIGKYGSASLRYPGRMRSSRSPRRASRPIRNTVEGGSAVTMRSTSSSVRNVAFVDTLATATPAASRRATRSKNEPEKCGENTSPP